LFSVEEYIVLNLNILKTFPLYPTLSCIKKIFSFGLEILIKKENKNIIKNTMGAVITTKK
tara:strand:+ start:7103 stop:7282 length:180 start_codon:yes stop_codon:yes gene_type:complete